MLQFFYKFGTRFVLFAQVNPFAAFLKFTPYNLCCSVAFARGIFADVCLAIYAAWRSCSFLHAFCAFFVVSITALRIPCLFADLYCVAPCALFLLS